MIHWNQKHGHAAPSGRTGTYRSWEVMKSRCKNKNDPSFEGYGGRGIGFCDRWNSFENFLIDMGDRPHGKSLDRIDVNGNYHVENCRWATPSEQGRNKRNNRKVNYRDKLLTIAELAEITGVPYQRLHERIVRRGWDVDRAVNEKPRKW